MVSVMASLHGIYKQCRKVATASSSKFITYELLHHAMAVSLADVLYAEFAVF